MRERCVGHTGRTIYFWHIPKTGGTSVRIWLTEHFAGSLCRAGIADELVSLPRSELESCGVFAGHFHAYLSQYLGRDVISCTLLRDPLARTRSHWNQVRRNTHHPYHSRVSRQSFTAFVEDDRNRVMIEDYQARYLAPLPIDLATLASRFSEIELSRYALAEALEQASLGVSKSVLAACARKTLESMAATGVCERLFQYLAELGSVLKIPAPAPNAVPHANVTERDDADALSIAALARLRDLTRVDQELYDFVCARVQGQTDSGSAPSRPYAG